MTYWCGTQFVASLTLSHYLMVGQQNSHFQLFMDQKSNRFRRIMFQVNWIISLPADNSRKPQISAISVPT